MHHDGFDLTDSERREVDEIHADMGLRGGRLADPAGRPIPWRVLGSRRFLVCDKGLIWRYAPAGSPQVPGRPGGTCRRNNAVEMWTGRWRGGRSPEGAEAYHKCLVWVPLDDHINGHPGTSKINWYRAEKHFKHPGEEPQAPSAEEVEALEGRRQAVAGAARQRMREEGLRVGDGPQPDAPVAVEPPAPTRPDAVGAAGGDSTGACGQEAKAPIEPKPPAPTKRTKARAS